MKVLLSTTGRDLKAEIDPRFGRAERFVLVDTVTGEIQSVANDEARDAQQGAGIKAAELAVKLGAKVVITGNCGPKAFRVLDAAGIEVYSGASGTLAKALDDLKAG
ncbi:MAG: NifB/NifX family molybdenum-iron cluster-binding protein, partial [Myxococcota bacterium]